MKTITLNDEEFDTLLVMCGYATGVVSDNRPLMNTFLRVANRINEGNEKWTPYEVPEESGTMTDEARTGSK